jgi:phage gp29-like protein
MTMRQSRILGPDGRPIQTAVLSEEISAPTLTGIRSVWDRVPIAGNLSPNVLADLLIEADQNAPRNYLTLAEEMEERDTHYSSVLRTRKNAISGLEIAVSDATEDAAGKKQADAVRALIEDPGFEDMVFDLLDAIGKGFSAVEIIWERGAEWRPLRYAWRDPRFFIFDLTTMRELRLLDDEHIMGVPLDPYKFLVHQPRLKSGIPIRGGLARLAAAAYMCKSYTLTDWMAFAELYGMPLRIGHYGQGATQDQINTLITAVANIGTDAAAVLPEGMQIEFAGNIGASSKGGGQDLFQPLADWLDRQVSKAVLGQTLTTDALSTGLGSNTASVHDEVRGDILAADKRQIEITLNRDLVRPFIDLNFGPQTLYPRIALKIFEAEDVTALSTAVAALVPLGLRVSQDELRDKIGLRDPDETDEVLAPPSVPSAPAPVAPNALALNAPTPNPTDAPADDDIDKLADTGASDWEPLMSPLMDAIERVAAEVAAAGGGEAEFRARLPELFQQMDEAALAEAVATATFKARALGDATDNPAA